MLVIADRAIRHVEIGEVEGVLSDLGTRANLSEGLHCTCKLADIAPCYNLRRE